MPGYNKDTGYIASLERQIQNIKRNREMEAQYMMLEEMLKDEREEGLDIMALLARELVKQKRFKDIDRCAEDKVFQLKM